MKYKTYWKDMGKALTKSWGRFFSIFSLMALGSLTLVGLKATPPNMEKTAQAYIQEHKMTNLSVMSSMGLDDADQKELSSIKGAQVEYGYLTDVTVNGTHKAFRLFSKPKAISTYKLVSGKLPSKADEIALNSKQKGDYKIGDKISFQQKEGSKTLKQTTFTITGFVDSSEIWDNATMGSSSAGDGELSGYGVTTSSAFDSDVYMIARLRYNDLKNTPYYSDKYEKKVADKQEDLEKLVADNGAKRLASIKKEQQKTIDDRRATIASKEKELSAAEEKLTQQEAALAQSGLPANSSQAQALNKAKSDFASAQKELTSKKAQLADAQSKLDALAEPSYTVYTRTSLPGGEGYSLYDNSTSSIAAVGNIFPVVLYVVAAMVTLTTMTRFVDEERNNSGILKALGYTNRQIMTKFVLYGLFAGLTGTIAGILFGNFILSLAIGNIITATTVIGSSQLYFYPGYIGLALGLSLLSTVLPVYLVVRKELTEKPAQLLQAKPPVAGSKILLERIDFIWKRLNFTHKVTARNIFRYKQRMLMTIFGVAGSVALLFAGLGLQSSISGVADKQFGDILRYDLIVAKDRTADKEQLTKVDKLLDSSAISRHQAIYTESLSEKVGEESEEQNITLMVADNAKLSKFISLQDRGGSQLSLTDRGAIISEKLANLYGVSKGDSIRLTMGDKKVTVKVAGITEMYTGHFIFMTPSYYKDLTGKVAEQNADLVSLKDTKTKDIERLASQFLKLDAVSGVSQNISLINQFNRVANSLESVMIILIVLSILLAVVILYNLTNINVAERIRELSTIKVLGFHNKEVTMYIYRETIVLSLIGIVTGLVGGLVLHHAILGMIGSSYIMFDPDVALHVYLTPILTIILILAVLGWFVNHHLRKVDMLEALKSVE